MKHNQNKKSEEGKETPFSFDTKGINFYVNKYIRSLGDLSGLKVLDCPAGDGRTTYQFQQAGAHVTSADLFPNFFKLKSTPCDEVDLSQGLPYDDDSFDIAICQEGIEHLEDQLFALQEFSRVLKKSGKLIITTPNISNYRSKLSYFFCESEYYKRSSPNELDSIWFSEQKKDQLYFGHIFLINALKLRTLSVFSGLKIEKIVKTKLSSSSLFLFPFFYLFTILANLMPYLFYTKKLKHVKPSIRKAMMAEQFRLNICPKLLLGKHLFMVFTKDKNQIETIEYLKYVTRT